MLPIRTSSQFDRSNLAETPEKRGCQSDDGFARPRVDSGALRLLISERD